MGEIKKALDSFMNAHEESFDEYFNNVILKKINKRDDYASLCSKKRELMNKYPKIMELFDRDHIDEFTQDENKALEEILGVEYCKNRILNKEAFKLGIKEAYIFFEEQDMLNT